MMQAPSLKKIHEWYYIHPPDQASPQNIKYYDGNGGIAPPGDIEHQAFANAYPVDVNKV